MKKIKKEKPEKIVKQVFHLPAAAPASIVFESEHKSLSLCGGDLTEIMLALTFLEKYAFVKTLLEDKDGV